jgi:hypothetical protein
MQNPVSNDQTPAATATAVDQLRLQDYHQCQLAMQRQRQYLQQQQHHQQHPSYSHPQQYWHWNRPMVMQWNHPHSSLSYTTTPGLSRATVVINPTTATTTRVAATNHQHHHQDKSDNNRSTKVKQKWQDIRRTPIAGDAAAFAYRREIPPSATTNTNTIPRKHNPPLARNVTPTAATSNNNNNSTNNAEIGIGISVGDDGNNNNINNTINNSGSCSRGSVEVSSGVPTESLGEGLAWPEGWTKTTRKRMGGKSAGTYDSYWISPRSKFKLRSIPEVKRFLAALQMDGGDEQLAKREFRRKKTTLSPPPSQSQSQSQSQSPSSETATATATTSGRAEAEYHTSSQKPSSLLPAQATSLHALQAARPLAMDQSTHRSAAAKTAAATAATTGIPNTAKQKDSSLSSTHPFVAWLQLQSTPKAVATEGGRLSKPLLCSHSGSGAHCNAPKLPQRTLLPHANTFPNTVAAASLQRPLTTLTRSTPTLAEGGPLTFPAQRTLTSNVSSNVSSNATATVTATATTPSVISEDSLDEIEFPDDHVVL